MANTKGNRIYMFANFGKWKKIPFGGGEVGNRRTSHLLKKAGFQVVAISKYNSLNIANKFLKHTVSAFKMPFCVLKFFVILLFGSRKAITHIVGFSGRMIFFELCLINIAKTLGYKVVYELRGGGATTFYEQGNKFYRRHFRLAIRKADCIFSQSTINEPLIKQLVPDADLFYYPNYVMPSFIPDSCPTKPADSLHLIYFGRIVPSKHVEIVIDTFAIVQSRFQQSTLDIIGDYLDSHYYRILKNMVAEKKMADKVKFYSACSQHQLADYLFDKHFFLLPSTEGHEGHSNSLTEAMAWGIIPITTWQGDNFNVLNNNRLIVNQLSAQDFADIVFSVVEEGSIKQLSTEVYNRVRNNYHYSMVCNQVKEKYELLFRQWFDS